MPFLQAMAHGTLPVSVFGPFMVQDIFYMYRVERLCTIAEARAKEEGKPALAERYAQLRDDYEKYIKQTVDNWHIHISGVDPMPNTAAYVNLQHSVAQDQLLELFGVVTAACSILWYWLRQHLEPFATETNLYAPFISAMGDSIYSHRARDSINLAATMLDEAIVQQCFMNAMKGEYGMFDQFNHMIAHIKPHAMLPPSC